MSPKRIISPTNNAIEDETLKLKLLAGKRSGVNRNETDKELGKVSSGADLTHVMGPSDYVGA